MSATYKKENDCQNDPDYYQYCYRNFIHFLKGCYGCPTYPLLAGVWALQVESGHLNQLSASMMSWVGRWFELVVY